MFGITSNSCPWLGPARDNQNPFALVIFIVVLLTKAHAHLKSPDLGTMDPLVPTLNDPAWNRVVNLRRTLSKDQLNKVCRQMSL